MFSNLFNPLAKPEPPRIVVGDIVHFPLVFSRQSLGKVMSVDVAGNGRLFVVAHKIDSDNDGVLWECPDKERCKHRLNCPIHTLGAYLDDERSVRKMSARDVAFYVKEGMIAKELVPEKPCPKP